MGFLSRKKPKPAAIEIQEEQQIVDDLQEMEEAVPEQPRDEGVRAAGPVSDTTSSPKGEDPASSPPTADALVVDEVPAPEALEDDGGPAVEALNEEEPEEAGDARMKAVDLIPPAGVGFLAEKKGGGGGPVETGEVF